MEGDGGMTSIKCKYRIWRCDDGPVCLHHNAFDNGYEYDENCDNAICKPYKNDAGMLVIPMQCDRVWSETIMFEKNVKSFSYDGDWLVIGRLRIGTQFIEKLIIDDEAIIDEEEK